MPYSSCLTCGRPISTTAKHCRKHIPWLISYEEKKALIDAKKKRKAYLDNLHAEVVRLRDMGFKFVDIGLREGISKDYACQIYKKYKV